MSAMSGVTDLLLNAARLAEAGDEEPARQARQEIARKLARLPAMNRRNQLIQRLVLGHAAEPLHDGTRPVDICQILVCQIRIELQDRLLDRHPGERLGEGRRIGQVAVVELEAALERLVGHEVIDALGEPDGTAKMGDMTDAQLLFCGRRVVRVRRRAGSQAR